MPERVNSVAELIEQTRSMPLETMRFFINEDRHEPRCFGIYQEKTNGYWVVYKNKADGSRAVRYSGPDEAYAAQELWEKINAEIELRRGNLPPKGVRSQGSSNRVSTAICFVAILVWALSVTMSPNHKPSSGYYQIGSQLYYYQTDDWYYFDGDDWETCDTPNDYQWYRNGRYSERYPYITNFENAFENSDYYESPISNSTNRSTTSSHSRDYDDDYDSIYDSWDSNDTDWDSDW